jgi:hypothetical protein
VPWSGQSHPFRGDLTGEVDHVVEAGEHGEDIEDRLVDATKGMTNPSFIR